MQLDAVCRLSEELQAKNENLERVLEELERARDVLVSRRRSQSWVPWPQVWPTS